MQRSSRSAAELKLLMPAAIGGLLVGFAFVFFFISVLHEPKPDGMKVGIVAPAAVTADVQSQLDQAIPGGIELRSYATPAGARQATRDQDVNGAFLADPAEPTLITAGALGTATSEVLHAAFGAAAAAQGKRLAVEDVAPLPAHDSHGISTVFLVAGTSIGSLVFAIAFYLLGGLGGSAPVRLRLALAAGFAIFAGLLFAADSNWLAGGLTGSFLAVAGIVALLAASISLSTTALGRWLGAAGLGLAALFFIFFSLPASGGAIGPDFVPPFYHWIAPALPSHAAMQALRGAVYFDGGGTLEPILILLAWIAGALAAISCAHLLRRPAPAPPAIGVSSELPAAG